MSEHSVINAGLTLVFIMYSIFVIIMGIWGHSITPVNCDNTDVRSGLRGLLVSGFISLSAFVCYGLCNMSCKITDPEILPSWFLTLSLALSIANLVMASQVTNGFSSAKATCQTGSYDSYSRVVTYLNVFSVVILVLSIIIIGKRGYEKISTLKVKVEEKRVERGQIEMKQKSKIDVAKLEEEAKKNEEEANELQRQHLAKSRLEQSKKTLEQVKQGKNVIPQRGGYGRSRWDIEEAPF